jgi:hypothetical protein
MDSLAFQAASAETLVEAIDAATAIYHFLLAGIERVAGRAHIDVKIFTACGTRLYRVAATTGSCYSLVFGVYICFHYMELLVIGAAT